MWPLQRTSEGNEDIQQFTMGEQSLDGRLAERNLMIKNPKKLHISSSFAKNLKECVLISSYHGLWTRSFGCTENVTS